MIYVAVIETILLADENGTVNACKTEEEGLKVFEDSYNREL